MSVLDLANNYRPRGLTEALDEMERELQVRLRVYDRWITSGQISRTTAQDQYDRMRSGLELLRAVSEATPGPAQEMPGSNEKPF